MGTFLLKNNDFLKHIINPGVSIMMSVWLAVIKSDVY